MDLNKWDQERYNYIKNTLYQYLIDIGFEDDQLSFLPISAFKGLNICEPLKNVEWYKEECLMQKIENMPLPIRNIDKPIRFNIYSC